jgi:branched-subunit amino acid ABC-type transport system permease component
VLAIGAVDEFVQAVIQGLPVGSVYALIAIGFTLTYKTSGILNLAFGAQAYVSAATYFELHVRREWPIWVSLLISVGILAPLIGVLLNQFVFKNLRTASPVARLVVTAGLMVALPEIFKIVTDFERESVFGAVGIVPDGKVFYRILDRYPITRDEIVQFTVAILGALILFALFRFTRLGLHMRGVVESPRMTELRGIDAEKVSSFAWGLSSLYAGLAGVLLCSTSITTIEPGSFFQLVIVAIAAAALGKLVSLPLALAGGFFLGIMNTILPTYITPTSIIGQNLGPSLPFVMLFAILVFMPGIKASKESRDPMAAVDPPTDTISIAHVSPWASRIALIPSLLMGVGIFIWVLTSADQFWMLLFTEAVIYSIIFLAITVFTGMGGQISLALTSFGAIGAFTVFQLTKNFEMSSLLAALIGAALGAAVGALLALPVLRLGHIWLALATLAFAFFFDAVMVKFPWVGPTSMQTAEIPRPTLGGLDFGNDKSFFLLCVVLLIICSLFVSALKRGTTGYMLQALRGSEVASQSVGINPTRWRIVAFAASSGLAAFGGALLVIGQESVNYGSNFAPLTGLFWLVLVITLASRRVSGAIQGGVVFRVFPDLILIRLLHLAPQWQFALFGLGAINFSKHPEGVLEYSEQKSVRRFDRLISRFNARKQASKTEVQS